jgi:hypothetical protein
MLHKLINLIEVLILETAEKEVQDTSCWGPGGIPQI